MNKAIELWAQVKDMLKASNDETTFNQTFAPITEVYKIQNNVIYLVVNKQFDIFRIKRFYLDKMNELLAQCTDDKLSFGFISKAEVENDSIQISIEKNQQPQTTVIKKEI